MKRSLIAFLLLWAAAVSSLYGQQRDIIYAGTFSERGSKGIYVFGFDRGDASLSLLQTVEGKMSPSYLELHPNGRYLYAAYREGMDPADKNGTVAAFSVDPLTGKLAFINERSSEGAGPCHVSVDPRGRFVYVSNYAGGSLAVYPVGRDGGLGAPSDIIQHTGGSVNLQRQQEPHVHSAIPSEDGRFLYVSDLGTDKIHVYKVGRKGKLKPAAVPFVRSHPGSGPRHFALGGEGGSGYSTEELSSTIAAYRVDRKTGALEPAGRVDMLDPGSDFEGANSAADIHLSPDGRFLYASNRGQDNLAIYAVDAGDGSLRLVGHESSRGKFPRNFLIGATGEFVFVANRYTDNVVVFRRDPVTGKLSYTGEQAEVPGVVCLKQLVGSAAARP